MTVNHPQHWNVYFRKSTHKLSWLAYIHDLPQNSTKHEFIFTSGWFICVLQKFVFGIWWWNSDLFLFQTSDLGYHYIPWPLCCYFLLMFTRGWFHVVPSMHCRYLKMLFGYIKLYLQFCMLNGETVP